MKIANKIVGPHIDYLEGSKNRHGFEFVKVSDTVVAMQEYAIKFGAWYSGMTEDKVKAALGRFEREESLPAEQHTQYAPGCECEFCRNIFRSV